MNLEWKEGHHMVVGKQEENDKNEIQVIGHPGYSLTEKRLGLFSFLKSQG